eukprot:UN32243
MVIRNALSIVCEAIFLSTKNLKTHHPNAKLIDSLLILSVFHRIYVSPHHDHPTFLNLS